MVEIFSLQIIFSELHSKRAHNLMCILIYNVPYITAISKIAMCQQILLYLFNN